VILSSTAASGSFRQNAPRCFSPLPSSPANAGHDGLCASNDHAACWPLIRFHDSKIHHSGGACARPPLGICPHPKGAKPPKPKGGEAPTGAGADRRTRWLALRQSLSLQRKGTAGPSRGPARLSALHRGVFPSSSRPPSGNGQGRPYGTPLIPQSFSPCVHPPPPARCRTDPRSWAGQ